LKGKTVDGLVAAIVAPAKARAAKAVSNGKLTQQRADELIARLTERAQALVQRVPATPRAQMRAGAASPAAARSASTLSVRSHV
jgi:hypothetical protein